MSQWSEDANLVSELHDALAERNAVTARARTAARAAFAWRTVDEDLMRLSYDSVQAGRAGIRSSGVGQQEARILSFDSDELSLQLELDGEVLLGQLVPGTPASVALVSADGDTMEALADEAGFFTFAGVPLGPVRLQVSLGARTPTTEWMTF